MEEQRVIPGRDRGDDADRLAPDLATVTSTPELGLGEAGFVVVRDRDVGPVGEVLEGLVELDDVGEHHRDSRLRYQHLTQHLAVLFKGGRELANGVGAELGVGRPRGLVEGSPGGRDGVADVVDRRV